MKKRALFISTLFVLLFFVASKSDAQEKTPQQKLDSILTENRAHPKQDSVKLVIYKAIYRQYMRMKNEAKIDEYIQKSVVLARKLNLIRFEADAYYRRALSYHGVANYQKAEEYYLKAVDAYGHIDDLDMVAGMYLNMGALYQGIPDYVKSLAASQKAIAIYQKNGNDVDLSSVYANISEIYQELGQQANALNYLHKALKIFSALGIDRGVAIVYNGIGNAYFTASEFELKKMGIAPSLKNEKALENLNSGLKVALAIDDKGVLSTLYSALGSLYEATGKHDLALESYLKSLDYANQVENRTAYGNAAIALASFYVKDKADTKALPLLSEALKIAEKNKALDLQKNAYLLLSSIDEHQGNYNSSLENYKKYIVIRDQIFSEEKEKDIAKRQLQIDFAVKEKDYQIRQQLTDGELQSQFLLAKQQQQQLELSDREKRLQRLTFLQKQADLENDRQFQANLLAQQQRKAKLDKQLKDDQIGFQKTQLRFNKNVNLFLIALAAVLFAGGLFVFYSQRKTARLNKLVSEQKQELEKLGRVKDRIFSVVSHDMRAPVNSLISFIQLLESGDINQKELTKYAGNLKSTLGYTSTMMENLLNWASSQMQGFKPVIEKIDVQACAQEVINSMDAIAIQKNIEIKNELQQHTFCLADFNMCALILRNLISNAIKFTPDFGVIVISAAINSDRVNIFVRDNGTGLSSKQIEDFNTPGFQENSKSTLGTNKEKGTGIGLILCKTFVNMMNGSIQARKLESKGTEFALSLPNASI